MSPQGMPGRRQPLIVEIEASPAYEFLMTLCAYCDAERYATYDVGIEWFDDVRKKASPDLLATVEQFSFHSHEIWEHMLGLVYDCPTPRDVPTLIALIEATDPLELRLHMLGYYVRQHRRATSPEVILQAAQGDTDAQKRLLKTSFPDDTSWQRTLRWLLSLEPAATKSIEIATGWEYVPEPGIQRIVLIPSYIMRPWIADAERYDTRIFCYPVADESIASDDHAPPVRLVKLAKALADERRLRILKKLATGSYTLQEIADDFGVAKTTMHHHLITLRSAGLVRMRMSDKRWSLRQDMVDNLGELHKTNSARNCNA